MIAKNTVINPCPVATCVNLIGNKWKLLILRNLMNGPARFMELKNGINDISQKVLTENLRSMEEDGIVIRNVISKIPLKVEYKLSNLGESLRPLIKDMEKWGQEYLDNNIQK